MSSAIDPPLVIDTPTDLDAAARSRVYALLAEAFAYPQGEAILRLLDGDWEADMLAAIGAAPLAVKPLIELSVPNQPSAIAELQIIYTQLFDVAGGTPRVSLLERRYGDTPEQELWNELLGFYGHFGLDFSQGYAHEQPDHLLTELGFMHYLSFLEAGARTEQDSFRRGQRDFLKLHLASWSRQCAEKLVATEQAQPYATLATLLQDLITADLEYLDQRLGTDE
jgi:putative dimethyl sulfoxide reductase chaperone